MISPCDMTEVTHVHGHDEEQRRLEPNNDDASLSPNQCPTESWMLDGGHGAPMSCNTCPLPTVSAYLGSSKTRLAVAAAVAAASAAVRPRWPV